MPEAFANDALYSISPHSAFVYLSRYGHAKTRMAFMVGSRQDLEASI
jgi:hypothetical protein